MDPFTDETLMPFGKHQGTKLANVPDEYLIWLYHEMKRGGMTTDKRALIAYIEENIDIK